MASARGWSNHCRWDPWRRWPYALAGTSGRLSRIGHRLGPRSGGGGSCGGGVARASGADGAGELQRIARSACRIGCDAVDGILLDLGLSSDQLADPTRGFSFQSTGTLDLRFDTTRGEPAWKLVERLSAEHLADLIYRYGEERYSRRIARHIVDVRRATPIHTAADLARVVRESVPRSRNERIDPATRTFQAMRIAVNEELKWLEVALRRLPDCLSPGGRLAVISFHSLEDRLVKESFRDDARLQVATRRPVRATEQEVSANPRSRSAKLRVAECTGA